MKIVILADSLALPREDVGNEQALEVTYPFLLDQSLRHRFGAYAPLVIERGMRRRTIEYVLDDWYEQVELKKADMVIVHVGIVDCAPRVFLRRERAFVERMRFTQLRNRILKFAHDHRRAIIKRRPRVYVPLARFERHVKEVVQKAQEQNVRSLIFVNIISPPDTIEQRSPGFQLNVERYNQVLQEQTRHRSVSLIDLNKLIRDQRGADDLTVDGIHLNEEGHQIVSQQIEARAVSLLEETNEVRFGITRESDGN
jgi:acyl-CoA thioesterase-1